MDKLISKAAANHSDRLIAAPPRAAYVHVPFCRHRCGYCNFTLVAGRGDLVGDYLRAIAAEIAAVEGGDEVDTLYFGGGTPTYLKPDQLRQLTSIVVQRHPLSPGYEFTVEANPADVDPKMIETLSALAVTRLSLGGHMWKVFSPAPSLPFQVPPSS